MPAALLVLFALGVALFLPLTDHHWAERTPGHEHAPLSAVFDPQRHAHSFASGHTHGAPAHGQQGAPYLAISDWDGSSPESVTVLAGQPVLEEDALLAPPQVFLTAPIGEGASPAGYAPLQDSPPPRAAL